MVKCIVQFWQVGKINEIILVDTVKGCRHYEPNKTEIAKCGGHKNELNKTGLTSINDVQCQYQGCTFLYQ